MACGVVIEDRRHDTCFPVKWWVLLQDALPASVGIHTMLTSPPSLFQHNAYNPETPRSSLLNTERPYTKPCGDRSYVLRCDPSSWCVVIRACSRSATYRVESRASSSIACGTLNPERAGVEVDSFSFSFSFSFSCPFGPLNSPTYVPLESNRAIRSLQYPSLTQNELSSATATCVGLQKPSFPLPGVNFLPNSATRAPEVALYRITWCNPQSVTHTSPFGPSVMACGM